MELTTVNRSRNVYLKHMRIQSHCTYLSTRMRKLVASTLVKIQSMTLKELQYFNITSIKVIQNMKLILDTCVDGRDPTPKPTQTVIVFTTKFHHNKFLS